MGHANQRRGKSRKVEPIFYRADRVRAEMAAQELSLEEVANRANLNVKSVMAVRKGASNIGLLTLKAVLDALGLTLREVFEPKPETETASAEGNRTAARV